MNKKKLLVLVLCGMIIGSIVGVVNKSPTRAVEKEILIQTNLFSAYVDKLVSEKSPIALSSNPYDYVAGSEQFDKIVDMGLDAVPVIEKLVSESEKDGLEEYMLVLAAQEILNMELHDVLSGEYNFISPKDWCAKYTEFKVDLKEIVDDLLINKEYDEIEKLGIIAIPYVLEANNLESVELNNIVNNIIDDSDLSLATEMNMSLEYVDLDYSVLAEKIVSTLNLDN